MSVGVVDRQLKKQESCGIISRPAERGAEESEPLPRCLSHAPRGSSTPRLSEVEGAKRGSLGSKQKSNVNVGAAADAGAGGQSTQQKRRGEGKSNGKSAECAGTTSMTDPMSDVSVAAFESYNHKSPQLEPKVLEPRYEPRCHESRAAVSFASHADRCITRPTWRTII